MNRVNPPKQLSLPPEVASNIQLKKAFDDRDFILFQLWKRVGGGADFVDNTIQSENEFDDLSPFVAALLPKKDDVVSTSIDYTTISNQVIICNDALTVFLNESPKDREVATVKITNGDVTVNAGSRLVDKQDFITVVFEDVQGLATLDIVYILEIDEWFII